MILVGRLSHLHPPAGGIGHHNPVLQWSWPSPSQWLVQGGRRQYAGGWTQEVASVTDFSVQSCVSIGHYVDACSSHGFMNST